MTTPLVFVRDGRTLPFFPVTVAAMKAIDEHVTKRKPYAIATYIKLIELANDDRTAQVAVTHRRLVLRTGASRSTVQRALKDLEAAGVLQIIERTHAGSRVENEYLLIEPGQQDVADTPASERTGGVASDRPGGASEGREGASEGSRGRVTGTQVTQEEETEEEGGRVNAPAGEKKYTLPDDFPEELRPHLIAVYKILRAFAERHAAKEVNPVALAYVVMANPRKRLVAAAHDYCAYWEDKDPKDVVAGYKNTLKRTDTLAAIEPLDAKGAPTSAPSNVTTLRGRGAQPLANTRDLTERKRFPNEITR